MIGICGNLGSGKSFIAKKLNNYLPTFKIAEIDDIRRFLLWEDDNSFMLRKELSFYLKLSYTSNFYWLNRTEFSNTIFSNIQNLNLANSILLPYLKKYISNHFNEKTFVVWNNLLIEDWDNLIKFYILVHTPFDVRIKRLIDNNHDLNLILPRINLELSTQKQIELSTNKNLTIFLNF